MEQEGITENELRRTLPHASEETIQKNIGNKNWLKRGTTINPTMIANAYDQLQRHGGNRSGKTVLQDAIVAQHVVNGGTVAKITRDIGDVTKAEMSLPSQEELKKLFTEDKRVGNFRTGEWCEIGGKRKFLRSHWEKNYAHYLEFLKTRGYIRDWNYETKTFWFEGIRRGVNNYKPDFFVILNDGQEEFREVKGFMDPKSKTKLKRMKKYFPLVKMRVIDGAWFKKNGKTMAQIVPGWTKKKVAAKPANP